MTIPHDFQIGGHPLDIVIVLFIHFLTKTICDLFSQNQSKSQLTISARQKEALGVDPGDVLLFCTTAFFRPEIGT